MPLTEVAVRSVKSREKPYKLADGLGLYLLVKPNGSRLWRLKYRFGGKEKVLALGAYPAVGLKDARERRDEARRLLADGRDPGVAKAEIKRNSHLNAQNSFERIARKFAENQGDRWGKRHALDVVHRLEKYIFPDLGARPIAEISPQELLAVIRKIEARGATELRIAWYSPAGRCFVMASRTACATATLRPICVAPSSPTSRSTCQRSARKNCPSCWRRSPVTMATQLHALG